MVWAPKSLDDLRTIPWVFAWGAGPASTWPAWYGLGTACEQFGDLDTLRQAYKEWPLFSTFIDNIEMSIAKTDERIAKMYLALDDREDLNEKVLGEMGAHPQVGAPHRRRRVAAGAPPCARPGHPHSARRMWTRFRSPRCWRSSRCAARRVDKEELSQSQQAGFIYLILCTVSGVAAGLQNTGLIRIA